MTEKCAIEVFGYRVEDGALLRTRGGGAYGFDKPDHAAHLAALRSTWLTQIFHTASKEAEMDHASGLANAVSEAGYNLYSRRTQKRPLTSERLAFLFDPSVSSASARAVLHWCARSRRISAYSSLPRYCTSTQLETLAQLRSEGALLSGEALHVACRSHGVSLAPPMPPITAAALPVSRGESGSQSLFEAFVSSKGADVGSAQSVAEQRHADGVAESVDVHCAVAAAAAAAARPALRTRAPLVTGVGRVQLLDPQLETAALVEEQIAELERRLAPAQAFYDGLTARVAIMSAHISSSTRSAPADAASLRALRELERQAFERAAAEGHAAEEAISVLVDAGDTTLLVADDAAAGRRTVRLSALAAEHAAYVKRERRFTKALGAFLKTQFDRRLTALVVRRRGAARGAPAPSAVLFPSEFADDTDSRALEQVETAMAGALLHRSATAAVVAGQRARRAALLAASEDAPLPSLQSAVETEASLAAQLGARFRARIVEESSSESLRELCARRAKQACSSSVLMGDWSARRRQQRYYEAKQRDVAQLLLAQQARHTVLLDALDVEADAVRRVQAELDAALGELQRRDEAHRAHRDANDARHARAMQMGSTRVVNGSDDDLALDAKGGSSTGDGLRVELRADDVLARMLCESLRLFDGDDDEESRECLTWRRVAGAASEQSERCEASAAADRARALAHCRRLAANISDVGRLAFADAPRGDLDTSCSAPGAAMLSQGEDGKEVAVLELQRTCAIWPNVGQQNHCAASLVPRPLQRNICSLSTRCAAQRELLASSQKFVTEGRR